MRVQRRARAAFTLRTRGRRNPDSVLWIVMHDAENPSAAVTAAWFANPDSRGSAHLCVDDRESYRTLENWQIPWGAPGANRQGFHIEQAGFARWSEAIWKTHLATLRRTRARCTVTRSKSRRGS